MRITESKLRSIIRSVIRESSKEMFSGPDSQPLSKSEHDFHYDNDIVTQARRTASVIVKDPYVIKQQKMNLGDITASVKVGEKLSASHEFLIRYFGLADYNSFAPLDIVEDFISGKIDKGRVEIAKSGLNLNKPKSNSRGSSPWTPGQQRAIEQGIYGPDGMPVDLDLE